MATTDVKHQFNNKATGPKLLTLTRPSFNQSNACEKQPAPLRLFNPVASTSEFLPPKLIDLRKVPYFSNMQQSSSKPLFSLPSSFEPPQLLKLPQLVFNHQRQANKKATQPSTNPVLVKLPKSYRESNLSHQHLNNTERTVDVNDDVQEKENYHPSQVIRRQGKKEKRETVTSDDITLNSESSETNKSKVSRNNKTKTTEQCEDMLYKALNNLVLHQKKRKKNRFKIPLKELIGNISLSSDDDDDSCKQTEIVVRKRGGKKNKQQPDYQFENLYETEPIRRQTKRNILKSSEQSKLQKTAVVEIQHDPVHDYLPKPQTRIDNLTKYFDEKISSDDPLSWLNIIRTARLDSRHTQTEKPIQSVNPSKDCQTDIQKMTNKSEPSFYEKIETSAAKLADNIKSTAYNNFMPSENSQASLQEENSIKMMRDVDLIRKEVLDKFSRIEQKLDEKQALESHIKSTLVNKEKTSSNAECQTTDDKLLNTLQPIQDPMEILLKPHTEEFLEVKDIVHENIESKEDYDGKDTNLENEINNLDHPDTDDIPVNLKIQKSHPRITDVNNYQDEKIENLPAAKYSFLQPESSDSVSKTPVDEGQNESVEDHNIQSFDHLKGPKETSFYQPPLDSSKPILQQLNSKNLSNKTFAPDSKVRRPNKNSSTDVKDNLENFSAGLDMLEEFHRNIELELEKSKSTFRLIETLQEGLTGVTKESRFPIEDNSAPLENDGEKSSPEPRYTPHNETDLAQFAIGLFKNTSKDEKQKSVDFDFLNHHHLPRESDEINFLKASAEKESNEPLFQNTTPDDIKLSGRSAQQSADDSIRESSLKWKDSSNNDVFDLSSVLNSARKPRKYLHEDTVELPDEAPKMDLNTKEQYLDDKKLKEEIRKRVLKESEDRSNLSMLQAAKKRALLLKWMKKRKSENMQKYREELQEKIALERVPLVTKTQATLKQNEIEDRKKNQATEKKELLAKDNAQRLKTAESLAAGTFDGKKNEISVSVTPNKIRNQRYKQPAVLPFAETRTTRVRRNAIFADVRRHFTDPNNRKRVTKKKHHPSTVNNNKRKKAGSSVANVRVSPHEFITQKSANTYQMTSKKRMKETMNSFESHFASATRTIPKDDFKKMQDHRTSSPIVNYHPSPNLTRPPSSNVNRHSSSNFDRHPSPNQHTRENVRSERTDRLDVNEIMRTYGLPVIDQQGEDVMVEASGETSQLLAEVDLALLSERNSQDTQQQQSQEIDWQEVDRILAS